MLAKEILKKTTYEERLFAFDFTKALDTGETVQSTGLTITVKPAGLGLTVSDIVVSTPKVQAKYAAGKDGTLYHLTCDVTTSNQKRTLCGRLKVEDC